MLLFSITNEPFIWRQVTVSHLYLYSSPLYKKTDCMKIEEQSRFFVWLTEKMFSNVPWERVWCCLVHHKHRTLVYMIHSGTCQWNNLTVRGDLKIALQSWRKTYFEKKKQTNLTANLFAAAWLWGIGDIDQHKAGLSADLRFYIRTLLGLTEHWLACPITDTVLTVVPKTLTILQQKQNMNSHGML